MSATIKDAVSYKLSLYDDRQRAAVESILDSWNADEEDFIFPIVDGPPGTGKTDVGTTAATAFLLENRNAQVAYLAYTHFAIERAQENFFKNQLPKDSAVHLHYDWTKKDFSNGIFGCDADFRRVSFNDIRRLKDCSVLLCTLHSSRRAFKVRTRPKILIDEFSQISPPMFFSMLNNIFAEKNNPSGYALLGDPIQLPVISTQATLRPNIGIFIMQRKPYDPHKLVLQHRMHLDVCEAVNSLRKLLNTHRIETGKEVESRTVTRMGYSFTPGIASSEMAEIIHPDKPLVIVNTDECGNEGRIFGGSVVNTGESEYAARIANAISTSYKDKDGQSMPFAVISPYTAQVGDIRQKLPIHLKNNCFTIYRSQGREYPCVIISFVRNNENGNIGFLGKSEDGVKDDASYVLKEQTYVGCSRAQGKLILLFSFRTFLGHGHPEFEALVETKNAHIIDRAVMQ